VPTYLETAVKKTWAATVSHNKSVSRDDTILLQRFPNMLALEKKMKTNNEISSSGCAVWNCFKCKWSLMANVERMSQQPQKG